MKAFGCFVLISSNLARAEQPHGTYSLDRGSLTYLTDGRGRRHPSCGGDKIFGGLATFVVEYLGKSSISVNGREWRFAGYTTDANDSPPAPDAMVTIVDPVSNDRIAILFATPDRSSAWGSLRVHGTRNGKLCADAWRLNGRFARKGP